MEFVSLDSEGEQDYFIKLINEKSTVFGPYTFVGGMTTNPGTTSGWRWVNSGKSINFLLRFRPGEPNNRNGSESCLNINYDGNQQNLGFNDAPCKHEENFICQIMC